jgi:hypothetical protein
VFGATGAPNLIPIHVLYHLILGEIYYQTIFPAYNASLVKDKKRDFIPYGFHIGFYMVRDTAHVKQEGLKKLKYQFHTGHFHNHDPKGIVPQHAIHVSSYWTYDHDNFEDKIFTKGA